MLAALPPDELYRLYQLLDDLAHMEAGAHLSNLILEEEEIKSVLPVIRSYYTMFFSIHEKQLAETLLHSNDPWKTLSGFPLYPRYEALIKGQMEALPGLPEKRIAFIGCGPVPMSLIFMARLYETRCLGLDTSEESVLTARKVIGALGLEDLVEIVRGDDRSLEDFPWDAVLVAALAEPKGRIFDNLKRVLSGQDRAIPVIYRTYTGMRAVLYEPVSPSDTKGFKIVKQVFPTGRVNNTTIFAELENE